MIKELRPNHGDDYSWQEVNCFFRAWAIVLQSYHSSYFNNFLQAMFLNWTFFPESIAPSENDDFMLDSNANVLSPFFGIRVMKVFYDNAAQFHKEIDARIGKKQRLIVPGDIYSIYYNAAYRTKHNDHYFIIKGCDEQYERYYILDNLHLKQGSSILYEDFVIPWDVLYESNQLFFTHLQSTSAPYFWAIEQIVQTHTNNTRQIFEANLHILNQYIDSYQDNQLAEMLRTLDNTKEQIQQFFMKFNHKHTYFKILHHVFQSLNMDTTHFEQLIGSFQQLKVKIPISLSGSESGQAIFEQYTVLEKELLLHMRELILTYLDAARGLDNLADGQSGQLSILNDHLIELRQDDHSTEVRHSEQIKTDTWTADNDAFQMLWPQEDVLRAEDLATKHPIDLLEVCVDNHNEPGMPFQSGIILVYEQETVLYGPIQNLSLSLFVPHRLANYCVQEIPYMNTSVWLKVTRAATGELQFYYKPAPEAEYMLFTTEAFSPQFAQIGVFSRTWEPIPHTTSFSNLRLSSGTDAPSHRLEEAAPH